MDRAKWIDRTFSFDFPEGWLPNIMERLRGTHARINEMTDAISEKEATYKPNGKWSIKQQIGHLSDLEPLHIGRINDFIERKEILRAADMANAKTNEANHNEKDIDQLIAEFANLRNEFIKWLETLDDDTQGFKSLHPRLKVMVRPVDIAYFTAEHDDHHLADIRKLLNLNK